MSAGIERPLRVSEVIAETMRLYGDRIWSAFGLGAVEALVVLAADVAGRVVGLVLLAVAFTLVFAAAARIVAGDGFREAWGQVAVRLAVLAPLGFVVAVPFAVSFGYLVLMAVAIAWLALTGLAIPVAMLERESGNEGWLARVSYALRRAIALARAGYLHALGVSAVLVLAYLVFGILLSGLLAGFADNSGKIALLLAQIVLAPFFFFGLAILYYDQRARLGRAPSSSAASPAA